MSFKAICGTVLALAFAGSVGTRAVLENQDEKAPTQNVTSSTQTSDSGTSPLMNNLTSGGTSPESVKSSTPATVKDEGEVSGIEKYLPTITEASFFAILGFAFGYATRKLVKVMMIVIAVVFAAIMGLQHLEIISAPNWGRAVELVNDLVLNIKKDQPFTEFAKQKLPSAGGFLAGILLGYRKG